MILAENDTTCRSRVQLLSDVKIWITNNFVKINHCGSAWGQELRIRLFSFFTRKKKMIFIFASYTKRYCSKDNNVNSRLQIWFSLLAWRFLGLLGIIC